MGGGARQLSSGPEPSSTFTPQGLAALCGVPVAAAWAGPRSVLERPNGLKSKMHFPQTPGDLYTGSSLSTDPGPSTSPTTQLCLSFLTCNMVMLLT